jgi:hypothetical protein
MRTGGQGMLRTIGVPKTKVERAKLVEITGDQKKILGAENI